MSAEHAASLESSTSAATAGATSDAQQVFEATQHFVQKYVPTDSVVSVLARQLEHELGDGDLRALLTFYSSPSGKLFVAVQPRLMAAVQAEIARMMAPHQQEMQDSLTTLIKNAPK